MRPELSIERAFDRDLERLPLPDQKYWVPTAGRSRVTLRLAAFAAAVLLTGVALGLAIAAGGVASPRLLSSPPLQSRPPCPATLTSSGARCDSSVPNEVRNPYGYDLLVPGGWHQVPISQNVPHQLDRRVYTARSAQEWVGTTATTAPAWDLDVQVWERQGMSEADWSRTFGNCGSVEFSFGGHCTVAMDTIHGSAVVVTTYTLIHATTVSYYVEHGDQMIILRYQTDEGVSAPPGVSTEALEGIVRSLGLI